MFIIMQQQRTKSRYKMNSLEEVPSEKNIPSQMCSNCTTCFFLFCIWAKWAVSLSGKSAFLQFYIMMAFPAQKAKIVRPVTIKSQGNCFCSNKSPTWNLLGFLLLYTNDFSMQMWLDQQSGTYWNAAEKSESSWFLLSSRISPGLSEVHASCYPKLPQTTNATSLALLCMILDKWFITSESCLFSSVKWIRN